MVQQFSAQVKAVSAGNIVVAGALSPLGRAGKPAPLAFMREMFCLTKTLRRACDLRRAPVPFGDLVAPRVHDGRPHAQGTGRRQRLARRPRGHEARPPGRRPPRARADAARQAGLLGDRVLLGLEPARPAGDPGQAPRALDVRGALPDVGGRRHARDLVEDRGRAARDEPVPVRLLRHGREGQALASPPSASRSSRSGEAAGPTSGAAPRPRHAAASRSRSRRAAAGGASPPFAPTATASSSARCGRASRTGSIRAVFRGQASLPFSLVPVRDRFVEPFGCGGATPC